MSIHTTESQIAAYLPSLETLAQYTPESGPISVVRHIPPDQVLSIHGVNHYKDPDHPQYRHLAESWEDFLELTKNDPENRLAIIEGRPHDKGYVSDQRDEEVKAITEGGESAVTSLWASREGVEVVRPEVPTADDAAILLDKFQFPPEEVVTFYAIRQASQLPNLWKVGVETPPYDDYITDYLGTLQRLTQGIDCLSDYDFSYDKFTETHEQFLGTPPSRDQVNDYGPLLSSFGDVKAINNPLVRTSAASFHNRNLHTGGVIIDKLIEGRSVSGPYGWYHVRRLAHLLRSFEISRPGASPS